MATYPGMEVLCEEHAWSCSCTRIAVTSPGDADLSVQLGNQPVVRVKDLTPAMVEQYMKETQPKAEPVDAADFYSRYPSFTIDFREGVVASASFESPGKIWLLRGGNKFKLPLSRRAVEAILGKPFRITRGASI
jgi:hypothetical protein